MQENGQMQCAMKIAKSVGIIFGSLRGCRSVDLLCGAVGMAKVGAVGMAMFLCTIHVRPVVVELVVFTDPEEIVDMIYHRILILIAQVVVQR